MTSPGALLLGLLALGVASCVSIPQEVKETFSPAGPGETSYFGRRPDAPAPEGFVVPPAAPAASDALAPSSLRDGGSP